MNWNWNLDAPLLSPTFDMNWNLDEDQSEVTSTCLL